MRKKDLLKYMLDEEINMLIIDECKTVTGSDRANDVKKYIDDRIKLLEKIEHIIETADKLKNAFFWTPDSNASFRRRAEKRLSCSEVIWEENGDEYSASIDVRCSCAHYYVSKIFYRNDKQTTLTAIKNSYKRLYDGLYCKKEIPIVEESNTKFW